MTSENVEQRIAEILKSMTPEEANKPTTWADIIGALTVWEENRMTMEDELDKVRQDSLGRVLDKLIDEIKKERYERIRFEQFITTLLCSVLNLDKNTVDTEYLRYQKAYDEVNLKKEEVNGR